MLPHVRSLSLIPHPRTLQGMTQHKRQPRAYLYWISTALVAAAFAFGGIADLLAAPAILAALDRLGYPAYLAPFLGSCKLLAVLALLAPRRPLLKEWAYAGMFFDLTGATYSHAAAGDPPLALLSPVLLLALLGLSYAARPRARALLVRGKEQAALGPTDPRSSVMAASGGSLLLLLLLLAGMSG